jgi:hypothetical protein
MNDNIVFKTVRKFDGFGAKISLRLHGDEDVKNLLGALISVVMLLASLLLSASTFLDFVYKTNPTVTTSVSYGAKNLTFNHDNFFMAISFYTPLSNLSKVRSAGNSTNDYAKMRYINELETQCTSCNGTYSNDTFLMNLCSSSYFSNINTLKSMSTSKSADIVNIFKTYSFCIPDDLQATLQDDITDTKLTDTSFQINIPINNVSIEFTSVSSNTKSINSLDSALNVISPLTTTTIQPIAPTPTTNTQPISGGTTGGTQPQPTSGGTTGGTQPQPTSGGTTGGTQPEPTSGGTTGGTAPQPTSGGTTGGTQPQPTSGGTTGGTAPQPTSGGTTGGTQPQPTSGTTTQPTSGTTTGGTAPQPTSGGTTTTQPTSGGSQPPPLRMPKVHSDPVLRTFTPRNLETVTLDSSVQPTYNAIINQFKGNLFPKMLLLHRSIEINTANIEKITKEIFFMDVLDYTDALLGTPVVYDVYIQKYVVNIDTGNVFSFLSSESNNNQEIMVISKIEKNSFDSINNNGAYLNFKFNSDEFTFNVTYVSLTSVLSVFGSFYSSFTLLAGIIAGLYNELYLKRDMIDSIFKFIENDPDPLEKLKKRKERALDMLSSLDREDKMLINSKERNEKGYFHIQANKVYDGITVTGNVINIETTKKDQGQSTKKNSDSFLRNEIELVDRDILESQNKDNKSLVLKDENLMDQELIISPNVNKNINILTKKKSTIKLNPDNLEDGLRIKDNIEEREVYRSIYNSLVQKKKYKKRVHPRARDFFCMTFCLAPCKKGRMKKYEIFEKCGEIIERSVEINNLVRKMFEIDFIKKLILTERQLNLLKFQFRYLNLNNYEDTMNFLRIFDHSRGKLDKNLFDNVTEIDKLDSNNTDDKLLEGLKNYYNY